MRKNKEIRVGLIGNPNSGKSTLFNTLTGSHQHVGNWPGKTIEKKEGNINLAGKDITIIDLPGIYSLSSFSDDERVSRDFIIDEKPDLLINIVDATNFQRNLYLTIELLELGVHSILCINMEKIARQKGIIIDVEKISKFFGIPVIVADARNEPECKDLIIKAIESSTMNGETSRYDTKPRLDYGTELEEHIGELAGIIEKTGWKDRISSRWYSIKLIEKEQDITRQLSLLSLRSQKSINHKLAAIQLHLDKIYGKNHDTPIGDMRHAIASGLIKECTRINHEKIISKSDRIDRIITNKYLGIPIFLFVVYLLFFLTFAISEPFNFLIEMIVSYSSTWSNAWLSSLDVPLWLLNLITNGLISGVGSVIVFVPNIFIMFFIISLLEDCGYLARAAFVMDNLMHKIGLHGKSFIPLILGFGCNVPAIMSTRSLNNNKDKILTIMITPFMSCSARLPVYVLFAGAFFDKNAAIVIFSLYCLGILLAILSGMLFRKIFFGGESSELIMEIPAYRLPTIFGTTIHAWERAKQFVAKAGSIILYASLVVWFLSNLPLGVEYGSSNSFIGMIGKNIAPIFAPLGFGFWEASVALLFGVFAKEIVVSTFATLYGVGDSSLTQVMLTIFTPLSAYAFMAMSLIYIPCIATIVAIKNETGSWKWAAISTTYTLIVGWIVAFLIFQGGSLLGLQ